MAAVPDPLSEAYRGLLREERRTRIDEVLTNRTRDLVLLLENLSDSLNISACLRTADAYGIQDVHVVDRSGDFVVSRRVAQGCHKWLDGQVWSDPVKAVEALQARGYSVLAAVLAPGSRPLSELELPSRAVLAFGNEAAGLSDALVGRCDGTFSIPMLGFSQSLNVSASVAASLQHARNAHAWPGLAPDDLAALRRRWYRIALKQAVRIGEALDPAAEAGGAWATCRESDP